MFNTSNAATNSGTPDIPINGLLRIYWSTIPTSSLTVEVRSPVIPPIAVYNAGKSSSKLIGSICIVILACPF
ncbi:hypothetical protein GCM10007275_01210 [Jeotgalicoccus coquinae]|nr:hypothetical protein GCM10007275_01210 [Jeotgalicoccus coquinae]